MKELWILAGIAGAAFGYKKFVSKPVQPDSPFGPSGCRLSLAKAKIVVDKTIKPAYLMMRPQIEMVPVGNFDAYRAAFYTVWSSLREAAIHKYTGLFVQRGCSQEDYNRAYEELSGLIACMMMRDLVDIGRIDEESSDVEKACQLDPRQLHKNMEAMFKPKPKDFQD